MSKLSQPPGQLEIEVSVFGPGYGEAVAVHFGNGKWMLVDSCTFDVERTPAPLAYLEGMDISPEECVSTIVVSHWHDDHVRGIGEIVSRCKSADVFVSSALKNRELITLASSLSRRSMMLSSGVDEFSRVVQERVPTSGAGAPVPSLKWAAPDRCLFRQLLDVESSECECSVHSLSPSDEMVTRAIMALSRLLPNERQPKQRIPAPEENDGAVAILVSIGSERILLGSDLEDGPHGWGAVMGGCTTDFGQPTVLKVPHHGSASSHSTEMWKQCAGNVCALLTPFRKGRHTIPTSVDVNRILGLTDEAYISTHPNRRKRFKPSNKVVRRFLNGSARWAHEVVPRWGQVRLRKNLLGSSDDRWTVELFGSAQPLDELAV